MNHHTEPTRWDEDHLQVRVLIECPPSASPAIIASVIERHGFAVRACEGPGDRRGCSLLEHGHCALVSGADVVVNMLRTADDRAVEILDAVTRERRPPEVVVEMTGPQVEATTSRPEPETSDPERVTVLRSPVSSARLIAGINKAIERRERRTPWWGDGLG